jgi:hypothetical protein
LGVSGTNQQTFLSLEEIQRGNDDTWPYFAIATMHHTHSSRVMSSLDPSSSFYKRNKNIILHHNVRTIPHHEKTTSKESVLFPSTKDILKKGHCSQVIHTRGRSRTQMK